MVYPIVRLTRRHVCTADPAFGAGCDGLAQLQIVAVVRSSPDIRRVAAVFPLLFDGLPRHNHFKTNYNNNMDPHSTSEDVIGGIKAGVGKLLSKIRFGGPAASSGSAEGPQQPAAAAGQPAHQQSGEGPVGADHLDEQAGVKQFEGLSGACF